ncbi:CHAP domain-containing protein [Bifidobacterium lemurum]|nr:CHAP domain-containing protein [Bifidobacterium lemurum]QOL33928.1 CHAP domain-containing protein [Bifidobacterium lemurum]
MAVLLTCASCSPLDVIAYLGGCKQSSSTGGQDGDVNTVAKGEVSEGMTVSQAQEWFGGADGPGSPPTCRAYPRGQCTYWACMRGSKLGWSVGSYWGNGGDWAASASKAGYETTTDSPVAGSIISFPPGNQGADSYYGHVAVVESVDTTAGTVTISEMNATGPVVSFRTLPIDGGATYILPDATIDGTGTGGSSGGSSATVNAAWSCRASSSGVVVDYDGDGVHATSEQAQAIAKRMIASGYKAWDNDEDWDALVWIWNHESGWRWDAENPSSGAYGIPQSLPANKMASAGDDWKDNAATQIAWGLQYIKDRYGSPGKAKEFWLAHNWY